MALGWGRDVVGALPRTPTWLGSDAERWWWQLIVRVEIDYLVPLRVQLAHAFVRQAVGVYSVELPGGVLVGALLGPHTVFWRVAVAELPAFLTMVIAIQEEVGYVDWY